MKFNWGHGLVVGMVLFMGYILFMVIWSFDVDHELETPDYYGKELKHQEQIDKRANYSSLSEELKINSVDNVISFQFPGEGAVQGTIMFYRPSAIDKDLMFNISLDSNRTQQVSKEGLSSGRYVIKVDWKDAQSDYYFEKNIVL